MSYTPIGVSGLQVCLLKTFIPTRHFVCLLYGLQSRTVSMSLQVLSQASSIFDENDAPVKRWLFVSLHVKGQRNRTEKWGHTFLPLLFSHSSCRRECAALKGQEGNSSGSRRMRFLIRTIVYIPNITMSIYPAQRECRDGGITGCVFKHSRLIIYLLMWAPCSRKYLGRFKISVPMAAMNLTYSLYKPAVDDRYPRTQFSALSPPHCFLDSYPMSRNTFDVIIAGGPSVLPNVNHFSDSFIS